MKQVDLYGRVRHSVLIEGISQREAARIFGIDPRTVAKMLAFSVPPGYRRRQARDVARSWMRLRGLSIRFWRQISWFQRSSGIRQSASSSGFAMIITLLAASRS